MGGASNFSHAISFSPKVRIGVEPTTKRKTMDISTIAPSYIWQAENNQVIGSKVGNSSAFREALTTAIFNHDTSRDRAEGQHFIVLSPEAIKASEITCGVGRKTSNINDYVMREWRGSVSTFLKRENAMAVAFCAVIVYTKSAYLADPQMPEDERKQVLASNNTHYLVALLANGDGVPNARSPYRLVDSLAGGNNEFENISIEDVKAMAVESKDYADTWSVVAD